MACSDESALGIYDMTGENSIPQGADWDVSIRYLEAGSPIDFSTATAKMQIRTDYNKTIILELNSNNGTILLGAGTGTTPNVVLKFTHANTSAMTVYEGIYDLEVTSATGLVYKFLKGKFQLEREVTL